MQPVATAVGLHDSWRPLLPAHAPGAGLGRRACGSAPPPPRRGHLPGPGVTPPPPCGTTRMPRAWSRGDGKEVQARQARHEEPCGYQGRHESHAPITPALVGSGVYGAVHKLVDERCRYPGWRRDARRYAWRASSGTTGQLPAQMRGDSCWLPGRSRRDRDRTGIRWLSTRDLWMRVTGQLPMFVPRSAGTDSSHRLVLPGREVPGPVAAWPAGVPGRG